MDYFPSTVPLRGAKWIPLWTFLYMFTTKQATWRSWLHAKPRRPLRVPPQSYGRRPLESYIRWYGALKKASQGYSALWKTTGWRKLKNIAVNNICRVPKYLLSGLKLMFFNWFGGPGGLEKLRETCRKDVLQSWYLNSSNLPSYDPKT